MPERSFGRTIKYRRNKLGLSQAKLGELVGRSAGAVRAWERDDSYPSDDSVITALSAVLGVEERILYDKLGQEPPEAETSPTIEQALATLSPQVETAEDDPEESSDTPEPPGTTPDPSYERTFSRETFVITAPTPQVVERSYLEDSSQRQLYRLRTVATILILIALGIAFLWALSEGLGALGAWWDQFFGNLRL